jgi:hypothetical protein
MVFILPYINVSKIYLIQRKYYLSAGRSCLETGGLGIICAEFSNPK